MAISTPTAAATLDDKFQNLDDEAVYTRVKTEAASDKALNFVVEFNLHEAFIAFNLTSDDFSHLAARKRKEGMVQWINIWSPSMQKPAVERIGAQYGFSKRLLAIMTAPAPSYIKQTNATPVSPRRGDVEKGSLSDGPVLPPPGQTQAQVLEELQIYQLVKETVNYTSIDQGKNCEFLSGQFYTCCQEIADHGPVLCIGANWLHTRPQFRATEHSPSLLPPRHWSWLALSSDGKFAKCSVKISYELLCRAHHRHSRRGVFPRDAIVRTPRRRRMDHGRTRQYEIQHDQRIVPTIQTQCRRFRTKASLAEAGQAGNASIGTRQQRCLRRLE